MDLRNISTPALLAIMAGAAIILISTVIRLRQETPATLMTNAIKFAGGACVASSAMRIIPIEWAIVAGLAAGLLSSDRVALALGAIAVLDYLHLPVLMSASLGILTGVAYQPKRPAEQPPALQQ